MHRVGMPRRHASRAHHLADHGREAAHDGVVVHRPRPDAAIAVAGDAVVDQKRRDVVHIGDRRRRGRAWQWAGIGNVAARHGFPGKQGVQGAGEIFAAAAAAIRQPPTVRLHEQRFAGACETQGLADEPRPVHQHRQRHFANRAPIGQTVGVHQQERHALLGVAGRQPLEALHVPLGGRAARAVRHQRDGAGVREIVQLVGSPVLVEQLEVVHPFPDLQRESVAGEGRGTRRGDHSQMQAHRLPPKKPCTREYGADFAADQRPRREIAGQPRGQCSRLSRAFAAWPNWVARKSI